MSAPQRPPALVGLHYTPTDTSMPIVEFARAAAERRFDAIVLPEHTHIPLASRYPTGDGQVPDRYRHVLDVYTTLAFVAASTNLNIGTCISLVAQHDPIALAKAIATLDHLSGGRFTLGVGYGWNRHELANHGKEFKDRRATTREYVALMRALWTRDEAEFHGEYANLELSWSWPKPIQTPSVPVLLGCTPSPRGFDDLAGWADGWIPICQDPASMAEWLASLHSRWQVAGRVGLPTIWALHYGHALDDATLLANLRAFRSAGVTQVLLDVHPGTREEVLPTLDRYASLLEKTR